MKLTRADLLRAVKSAGYSGDESALDSIKAWIAAENAELDLAGDDIDTVWARESTFKRKIAVEASKEAAEKTLAVETAIQDDDNAAKGIGGFSPVTSAIHAARKAYDQRAKLGKTHLPDADTAEKFGAWARSVWLANTPYSEKSNDSRIAAKVAVTFDNTLGGALVPNDFLPFMLDNFEKYGVARQIAGVQPMSRDTLTYTARTGDVTVYAPGEAGSITASDQTFANKQLVATKLAAMARVSTEQMNDSAFSFGETVAESMARAFAKAEDQAFFLGDGTATYWGFRGIKPLILSTYAGYTAQASGSTWGAVTAADFINAYSKLPDYAASEPNVCAVMSRAAFYQTYGRLAKAVGGLTMGEFMGKTVPLIEGIPVIFSQIMPTATAGTTSFALIGSFPLAAKFGQVNNGLAIAMSDQKYFDTDEIAFRGIERVAVTVHDVGDTSTAGPVVAVATG